MSYKPQRIDRALQSTVRDLLQKRIRSVYTSAQFNLDVMKPIKMEELMDRVVINLSGGALQRLGLVLALRTLADIYLIDEPSTYIWTSSRGCTSRERLSGILFSSEVCFNHRPRIHHGQLPHKQSHRLHWSTSSRLPRSNDFSNVRTFIFPSWMSGRFSIFITILFP